jgi:hypothetical protein
MAKLIEWLKGKKTYIVAIVAAVTGVLQAFGVVIPEYVYAVLAALGISAVRAAITK